MDSHDQYAPNGFYRTVISLDQRGGVLPQELGLLEELEELTADFRGNMLIESVDLLWVDDPKALARFLSQSATKAFANYHTSWGRKSHAGRVALAATELGQIVYPVGERAMRIVEGTIEVPVEHCTAYGSIEPGTKSISIMESMDRESGVITGLDDLFVRGYKDGRVFTGIDYQDVSLPEGELSYVPSTTIRRLMPHPHQDQALIVASLKQAS